MSIEPNLKTVPHNLEAEQALLGIILFDPPRLTELDGVVSALDFYEPLHQVIFVSAQHLARTMALTPPALHARLEANYANLPGGDLRRTPYEQIGGMRYLADLIDRAPMGHMAAHFGGLIREAATRRELVALADRLRQDAQGLDAPDAVISKAEWGLRNVAAAVVTGETWRNGEDTAACMFQLLQGEIDDYVPSGLPGWDARTGGFPKGQLIVEGGRPGMGKTALALQRMVNVARQGYGVGMVSLEMGLRQLTARMGSTMAFDRHNMPNSPVYFDLRAGRMSADSPQGRAMAQAAQEMRDLPIFFDERPGLTPSAIAGGVKRLIRDFDKRGITPGFVIVDHLHIVNPDESSGNRTHDVSGVADALMHLARESGIPILALCQLSRANEARGNADKEPQMSDLRWSGEIEQNANVINFIHRPEKYLKPPADENDLDAMDKYTALLERYRGKAYLLNVKNRDGEPVERHALMVSLPHNAFWEGAA